jgi:hypothetical protein
MAMGIATSLRQPMTTAMTRTHKNGVERIAQAGESMLVSSLNKDV